MSSEAQPGDVDSIPLHFCQRCGISIPVADVESGRAEAAPGGFICAGCHYQTAAVPAASPEPAPRPAVAAAPSASDGGARFLAAIAILYVVGASTFLLFRELNRQPPVIELDHLPTTADVQRVVRQVEGVDALTRQVEQRVERDGDESRKKIETVAERLVKLEQFAREQAIRSQARDDEIMTGVATIAQRTLGLDGKVSDVLVGLKELPERGGGGTGPAGGGDTSPVKPPPPQPPTKSKADLEKEREVKEAIAKLRDKKADETTRYNAAVALGDSGHADAVGPLIEALRKDPVNLVQRAAAWALGELGKLAVAAIPDLINQIGSKQEFLGYMSARALEKITESALGAAVKFKFDTSMSLSARKKVQRQWEKWWEKNKANLSG